MQQPHPPILVGGGGEKLLKLAGREADIVGINPSIHSGQVGKARWEIPSTRPDEAGWAAHRATLEEGPGLYKTFRDKKDGCIKVVLKPGEAPRKAA